MMALSGANTGEFLGGHGHSTPLPMEAAPASLDLSASLLKDKTAILSEELGIS